MCTEARLIDLAIPDDCADLTTLLRFYNGVPVLCNIKIGDERERVVSSLYNTNNYVTLDNSVNQQLAYFKACVHVNDWGFFQEAGIIHEVCVYISAEEQNIDKLRSHISRYFDNDIEDLTINKENNGNNLTYYDYDVRNNLYGISIQYDKEENIYKLLVYATENMKDAYIQINKFIKTE